MYEDARGRLWALKDMSHYHIDGALKSLKSKPRSARNVAQIERLEDEVRRRYAVAHDSLFGAEGEDGTK